MYNVKNRIYIRFLKKKTYLESVSKSILRILKICVNSNKLIKQYITLQVWNVI